MREVNFLRGVRDSETSKINQVLFPAKNVEQDVCDIEHSVAFIAFFRFFRSYRLEIARKNKQGLIPLGPQNDVKRLYRIKT